MKTPITKLKVYRRVQGLVATRHLSNYRRVMKGTIAGRLLRDGRISGMIAVHLSNYRRIVKGTIARELLRYGRISGVIAMHFCSSKDI